eukprot:11707301-Ditylum_brightwellii.AAC.1
MTGGERKEEDYESGRKGIKSFYTEDQCHSMERARKVMNNWLTVVPRTANYSVLNKEEFRDQVLMRYLMAPNGLPTI